MLGAELWLLLAAVAVNRWFVYLADCSRQRFVLTLLAVAGLLWALFPALLELGASPLRDELQGRRALVCILVCCEAWFLLQPVVGHWRVLSPVSLAGVIYLLALILQSGWSVMPFEAQAVAFFGVLLLVAASYRVLAKFWDIQPMARYLCLPATWLLCWLGGADWPQLQDVVAVHPGDTFRLLVFLFVLASVTLLIQRALRVFYRTTGSNYELSD